MHAVRLPTRNRIRQAWAAIKAVAIKLARSTEWVYCGEVTAFFWLQRDGAKDLIALVENNYLNARLISPGPIPDPSFY